ncbi:thymidylate synthase [Fomitiporia mediterranea MF3/22]|uniref:thymidylate synthase n=1 Tax=Fomitiporia mediterranea (strain MF3/22) TaxID=694068 RepID=UPI0004408CC7|nr:thymidylate synthase [Fomitiporia mediterranea MF3/22]EJD01981.1 thymidylate synthase [Fomitiporia mediterranea MF3/22]
MVRAPDSPQSQIDAADTSSTTKNGSVTVNSTPTAPSNNIAPHEEYQYINLIRDVLALGEVRADRTGTGTLSVFAPQNLRFSLADNTLPLLTTKRVFLRGIVEELIWFIRGQTDSTLLSKRGVKIWDGNGSKEFLEKRGLTERREGDLGPVYGFQWRHFGAKYVDCDTDYSGQGVDQIREVIGKIREDPTDRRIILSAWNPADIPLMALPPCHLLCQFYVSLPPPDAPEGTRPKLSCLMYQRSADLGLGVPFNIASYAILTHIIAHLTDTDAHTLTIQLGDAHVYRDHVDALKVQLEREPRAFPKIRWRRHVSDLDEFEPEDVIVDGYTPHPPVAMKMSV